MNAKKIRAAPFILATLVFFTVFLLLLYAAYVADTLTSESSMHLTEVARQGAALVAKQNRNDISTLTMLADDIISNPDISRQRKGEIMNEQSEKHSFLRLGYADGTGAARVTGGYSFAANDYKFFEASMRGEEYVCAPVMDDQFKMETIVFSVPINVDGQVRGVVFGSYKLETLMDAIDISFYGQNSTVLIINSNGDLIVYPEDNSYGTNIFDVAAEHNNMQAMQALRDNIMNGNTGVVQLVLNGENHFVSYAPIGVNDWYLVSPISAKVVFGRSASVIKGTLAITFCIALIFSIVVIYIFITLKKSNAEITTLAYYDTLTGAPNIEKFRMDARSLIHRNGAGMYLLLYIDTRHFRYLNKEFGYEVGDEYLINLTRILRETVTPSETFARISGDMFVLLYKRKSKSDFGVEYWARIRDKIVSRAIVEDKQYLLRLNCGVYALTREVANIQTAIDRANLARKALKDRYDVDIMLYNADMQQQIDHEKEIELCMNTALENDEFTPYMQPKYSLYDDGRVVGAEALVRWIKPNGVIVNPDEFIPLFEKNGFIAELDLYMLETVCSHMREQLDSGISPVPTSINQSRCYMYNAGYVETICAIIEKYRIPPHLIEFEITENIAYKSMDKLIAVIERLKASGFQLSLDDFGSGYSSLNVLKDLHVDVLKLDRVFLGETIETQRGQTVVANIIRMAKELSIDVVAEGVETIDQVDFLKTASCDMAQGFYFSRPIPMAEFEKLLAQQEETPTK